MSCDTEKNQDECECVKNSDRLTVKELYQQYWHCRDFELKNLWQRSVFLAGFIFLSLSAYGAFFIQSFISSNGVENILTNPSLHIIALLIGVFGWLFSVLWIYMAKGSKAWYEVYERAIGTLDTQVEFSTMPTVGGFKFERHRNYYIEKSPLFNNKILNTQGGTFSPSKINIVVGQIIFLFWSFLMLFHISVLFISLQSKSFHCEYVAPLILVIILIVWVLLNEKRGLLTTRIYSETLVGKDPHTIKK